VKSNWLVGKTVLITGASSGIGRSLTEILIRTYSCRVIGIGRDEQKMINLKISLGHLSDRFDYQLFDVSDQANWIDFSEMISHDQTSIDILINNAGVMSRLTSIEHAGDFASEQVRSIMATDFLGAVDAIARLLPVIRQSSTPAIINMSSAAAFAPMPGTAAYSAAKAALKAYSEALASETRKRIYVSAICPGFVRTDLFRGQDEGLKDERLRHFWMDSDRMARKIVKQMKRRKRQIFPGAQAKIIYTLVNLFGIHALDFFSFILRKAKVQLFSDVFD